MRDTAMLNAQKRSPVISDGKNNPRDTAIAKALIECPDGNENWSGGSNLDQQCSATAQGRFRPVFLFRYRKITDPIPAADTEPPTAAQRCSPPKNRITSSM